jgi:hypothetical protein
MTLTARQALDIAGKSAVISDCGRFRYHLTRVWNALQPRLVFLMLNPSTADAEINDPTIRRCAGFALSHGYGGFEVVNLFAFRATFPKDLRLAGYPVGPENDTYLEAVASAAADAGAPVCLAYGANVEGLERPQIVLPLLRRTGVKLVCLQITRSGYPQHPVRLAGSCQLKPFDEAAIEEAIG